MLRGKVFDVIASPHPSGGAVVTFDDVTSFHMLAERYRRVVETSRDAIVITSRAKRIEFANPAADDLFGYADGAIIGMPSEDLLVPDVRDDIAKREDMALAGEPQRYEAIIVRADGDRRTVAVSTAPLREVGQITGIVASLRDITEERRARDAVTQSEVRYRNLFETATDAIFTLDKRAIFTSANLATCQITGYPREALLGRSVLGLLEEEELAAVKAHFKDALAGTPQRYECHFYRKTGDRRLASVTNTPILRDNAVVGVIAIVRDLTADRAREEALVRSEARYLRLVESASDAIFTIDADGRVTSVNRALERAIGRSRGELFGMRFIDVIEPSDRNAVWSHFEATIRGERVRGEIRYRDAQNALRVGSVTMTPIVEDGRVTGCLGIVRDMTEERTLAEQLLQREKLAAVGQLVSGVAHELNNPLAGDHGVLAADAGHVRGDARPTGRARHDPQGSQARREDRVEPADLRSAAASRAHRCRSQSGATGHARAPPLLTAHEPDRGRDGVRSGPAAHLGRFVPAAAGDTQSPDQRRAGAEGPRGRQANHAAHAARRGAHHRVGHGLRSRHPATTRSIRSSIRSSRRRPSARGPGSACRSPTRSSASTAVRFA